MSGIYFSHDSSARGDEKIIALRMKHGWAGYGLYWALIEKLVEATCYTLAIDYNLLAFDLRTDASLIKSIINEYGLFSFTENGECFYSDSLLKRMQLRDEKINKLSSAGKAGNQKRWGETKGSKDQKDSENQSIKNNNSNDGSPPDRHPIAIKEINELNKEKKEREKKDLTPNEIFLSKNQILSSDNSEFLSSEGWFEAKAMQLQSETAILLDKAKDFLVDLRHRDQIEGKSLQDLRSHFVSWFKLKREHESPNKPVTYRIPKCIST